MASTNKTTNYDLSQYIGTDKPTYLTDYNQDMSKIDTGIHAAKSEADNNATSIGTLSNLTTTAKTDLVSAVNEIDGEVATNTNNIATNTSNIATNTTHIGTLTNLTTSSKTDLVVAANEINAKVGDLTNLTTSTKSSAVGAINEVEANLEKFNLTSFTNLITAKTTTNCSISSGGLTLAKDSSNSIFKLYGNININITNSSGARVGVTYESSLTTDERYAIEPIGIIYSNTGACIGIAQAVINTNGDIEIAFWGDNQKGANATIALFPCIYFNKNFGDTPQ